MKVVRAVQGVTGFISILVASLVAPISYAEEETIIEEMVVTGSRIVRSGADAPSPMTVVTAEDFNLTGEFNLGDYLNELPQLRSTFSLQNSGRFIGTTGLNLLDLRGMGTNRTLVLQDGRRHIGAYNGTTDVDINAIPDALVERVELITGGASAVYGADAVTGVVNFIMKDDFEGLTVRADALLPEQSGGESYSTSVTWGMNFSEGRGNIALSADWTDVDQVIGVDRDWIRRAPGAIYNPEDTGPDDGIPNVIYVNGTRDFRLNSSGQISGPLGIAALFGVPEGFIANIYGAILGSSSTDWTFDQSGSARAYNYGQTFRRAYDGTVDATAIGGDGLNFGLQEQVLPEVDRINLFGRARYDFTDYLTVKVEGKYSKTDSFSYTQPSFLFVADEALINVTENAFLPEDLRQTLLSENIYGILNDVAWGGPACDPGIQCVYLNRMNYDLGFRTEDFERETMRFVVSAEGDIGGGWSYDAAVVYAEYDGKGFAGNNVHLPRLGWALDAVLLDGEIVCQDADARANGCVPLNLFGENQFDPAARDYIMEPDSRWKEKMKQTVVSAYATGPIFALPAGDVQMAIGGEYRKEESSVVWSEAIKTGVTFFTALADTDAQYDVVEGFAELSVPLINGVTGFQDVIFDAALRVSDYDTIGGTTAWKFGLDWQVVDDLRVRTTLSKAVRAPNIGELFDPLAQNFFSVTDPCSDTEIPFAPNPALREKNCLALGKPDEYVSVNDAATIGGLSGGNEDLMEETADTFTVGVVLTPRFAENLVVSVDYWEIQIDDAIAGVSAQNILNKCVDGPSIDNIYCPQIRRDADFDINADNGITVSTLNIASLEAEGIDYEVRYVWDLARNFSSLPGTLELSLLGQHLMQRDDFEFQEEPDNATRIDGILGDPTDQFQLRATYQASRLTLSWRYRWLDSMRLISWDSADELQSPYKTTSWGYHELQGRYLFEGVLGGALELFAGVRNLTDEEPEYPLTGNGGGSGIYDTYGRTYYFGLQYDLQ